MIEKLRYFSGKFLLIFIVISYSEGQQEKHCSSIEQSSLCFCRSNLRRSSDYELFLSKVYLKECSAKSNDVRRCQQAQLDQSSQRLVELLPNLINLTRCYENERCLHSIVKEQRCQQCQIIPSTIISENISYVISTTKVRPPTDSCFYLCEHDHSCGFLCFDRRVSMKIQCNRCNGRRQNVTCRCIRERPDDLCSSSFFDTTTARWMQKRGFPAAGILGLLVLAAILLIIAGKSINRRLSMLTQRKTSSIRRSIATITTYRSRQPSPSTILSFPNTPLIPATNLRKEIITTTTNDFLTPKSLDYVVDVQRRDDEDELSVYLFEKTSSAHPDLKDILDIDDDEEDDDRNQT